MPVGNACLLARAKLSRYVSDLKQASAPEKFTTGVKAGYLLNFKSAARNIVGNTGQAIADQTVAAIASAADYTQALVRSAATGGRVRPHELREIASALNRQGIKFAAKGVAKGMRDFKEIMRTGINVEQVAEKFDHPHVTYDTPALEWLQQKVFGFYEGSDRPFFEFAKHVSMYTRTRLAGIRAGLKGADLEAFIEQGMKNPTEDTVLGANFDAAMSTYKNTTQLARIASDARRGLKTRIEKAEPGGALGAKIALIAMDLTMPFTKVAGAIANVAVDYSPLGFAKAAAYTMDRNPVIQREIAQRLLKASAGTGLMLWGYKAAKEGNATGSMPVNQGERARWDVEGKSPNSIKIGGEWRSLTILGPLAIPFLIGANIAAAEDTDVRGKIMLTAGFLGKALTEMTFLSGIKSVVEGLSEPEGKGAAAMSRVAAPLPAIVGQAAQAVDPVERQAEGLGEQIQKRIPFASKALPPRLSPFGDTIRRAGGVRAIVDPTAGRKATDDQITSELDRLDVNPGRIGKQLKLEGQKVKRTQLEVNDLTAEFGPIKRAVLEAIITSPDYQGMSDPEKKEALESGLRDVTGASGDIDRARRTGDKVPRQTPKEFLSNAGAS